MDGEQTESFTAFGQALDAAAAKREQGESSHTSGEYPQAGENGGQSASHTPGDGTSSTTQGKSGTSNSANGDTSANSTGTKPAKQGSENQRDDNYRAASRRHRQRESAFRTNQRIQQLRSEQQELLRTGDEQSIMLAHQKGSEIDNLEALQADAEYRDFSNRAAECFGDRYEEFLDRSEKFAEYVNRNEPGLVKYIDRDYGLFVYDSWMQQMQNTNFREQWAGLTNYEKEGVLNSIYKQILNFAKNGGKPTAPQGSNVAAQPSGGAQTTAGNGTTPASPANVPIPGSGRESNIIPQPDNFGQALANAAARRGQKF